MIIAAPAISLDYTIITANMRDFWKIDELRMERLQRTLTVNPCDHTGLSDIPVFDFTEPVTWGHRSKIILTYFLK